MNLNKYFPKERMYNMNVNKYSPINEDNLCIV